MEKVKLPREVAEAIEYVRGWLVEESLYDLSKLMCETNTHVFPLRDYIRKGGLKSKKSYYQALVNGYEVEQTPEDKVRELFKNPPDAWNPNAYLSGVMDTLTIFNIKISGVNTE